MDDAQLDLRLREDRFDRFWKAFQSVHAGDQHVLDPAILELCDDAQPELRAFILRRPKAKDLLAPLLIDADRQVDRAVGDPPVLLDLHHQRVQVEDDIELLQRPPLPGADFLNHTVGDGRDQLRRDLHAVDLFQMPLDLARGHPPRVERNDLVVEAVEARLPLFDELRLELSIAVPRDLDRDLSLLALERLTRLAVAGIARILP